MIYPTDFRQRVQKQHKTRVYRAMLDQQVRQNHVYNNDPIVPYNKIRYKSQQTFQQPLYSQGRYDYGRYRNQQKQLSPVSKNIINHQFKYIPSHDLTRMNGLHRGYESNYKAYGNNKQNQQSDNDRNNIGHIDKCLDQCNSIINNIKKTYIKINKIGNNESNHNHHSSNLTHSKSTNTGPRKSNLHGHSNYTNRKIQPINYSVDEDVGRNQMMNYVLSKSRMNQLNSNSSKSPKKKQYSIKKILYNNDKMPKKLRSKSQMNGNQDDLQFQKRQKQKNKQHQILKNRDKNILEHLRKAKNKGGVLSRKIQLFKKQSQTQNQQLNMTSLEEENITNSEINIDKSMISLNRSKQSQNRQQRNESQLSNTSKK